MMHVGCAFQISSEAAAVLVTAPEKAGELGLTPCSVARGVPLACLAEAHGWSQRCTRLVTGSFRVALLVPPLRC